MFTNKEDKEKKNINKQGLLFKEIIILKAKNKTLDILNKLWDLYEITDKETAKQNILFEIKKLSLKIAGEFCNRTHIK
jgi:hypothetical protein